MAETATGPRIAPVQPPYGAALAELLSKWMPPNSSAEPLALFRTLAVHDELAARMRPLGAGILGHGRVEPRDRELIIHRTCALTGAEYEWGVHAIAYGKPLGLTDEQLAATVSGESDDPAWSEHDTRLMRLADELHARCDISDELWAELTRSFTDDQLLELVITAGWYRLIAGVINTARVRPEPWAMRFPAK